MKDKLIIHNYTELADYDVIKIISDIIALGKISSGGTNYCIATRIGKYGVFCDRHNNTYTFRVIEE